VHGHAHRDGHRRGHDGSQERRWKGDSAGTVGASRRCRSPPPRTATPPPRPPRPPRPPSRPPPSR
jgi:hypothetical protein